MPTRDFDAARRSYTVDVDPVVFRLGGEEFLCMPTPSLGDVFDLVDCPDIAPEDFDPERSGDVALVRTLSSFIRRMLDPEDRNRFDDVLHRIPSNQGGVIIACAGWIAEQVTAHPSEPPENSSSGRRTTGPSSNSSSDGTDDSS